MPDLFPICDASDLAEVVRRLCSFSISFKMVVKNGNWKKRLENRFSKLQLNILTNISVKSN